MHEAEVAFLDEVEQGQARRLVALGDRDHQAEVRLDEPVPRPVTSPDRLLQVATLGSGQLAVSGLERGARGLPGLDLPGQASLVVLGEQRVTADVVEVETHQVLIRRIGAVGAYAFPSHRVPSLLGVIRIARRRYVAARFFNAAGPGRLPRSPKFLLPSGPFTGHFRRPRPPE